ncbi:MAG: peptidoglycan binding domain-containing protein, partial [Chloroflexota bacterium]|nr:peptidoglycan binding domain-containing protein [Chloroflexota bacterium]
MNSASKLERSLSLRAVKPLRPGRLGWFLLPIAVLCLVLLFAIAFEVRYASRMLPGVSVMGTDVGGKSAAEVASMVSARAQAGATKPVTLRYGQAAMTRTAGELGLAIDADATVGRAFEVGRTGGMLKQWLERFRVWRAGQAVAPVLRLDESRASRALGAFAARVDQPVRDAEIRLSEKGPRLEPSQVGLSVDTEETVAGLSRKVESTYYSDAPVTPVVQVTQPEVTVRDLGGSYEALSAAWSRPLVLTFAGRQWALDETQVRPMLRLVGTGKQVQPALDEASALDWLQAIKSKLDREPRDAKLRVEVGQVLLIKDRDGWSLQTDDTLSRLQSGAFSSSGVTKAAVRVTPPRVTNEALAPAVERANAMISRPLELRLGDRSWSKGERELTSMLRWKVTPTGRTPWLDPEALRKWVASIGSQVNTSPANARVRMAGKLAVLVPHRDGVRVKVSETVRALQASSADPAGKVDVVAKVTPAEVQSSEVRPAVVQANRMIRSSVKLELEGRTWTVYPMALRKWLQWRGKGETIQPRLDPQAVRKYVSALARDANREPSNAYISLESAPRIVADKPGVEVSVPRTAELVSALANSNQRV